ncbi:hypothetical protein Q1695_012819 [Nippostrongylus brasiliensis]|nr:hypothetical protein Q1695_012819 [Nippostrongylus brasiliensis]
MEAMSTKESATKVLVTRRIDLRDFTGGTMRKGDDQSLLLAGQAKVEAEVSDNSVEPQRSSVGNVLAVLDEQEAHLLAEMI